MTSYKRAIIVGAIVTWCRKYFHSGTSSFHFRIFLCICLPNNNTETTLPSLRVIPAFCCEWNSRFIPLSRKWTFFRIENCRPCSLGNLAHAYLIWRARERLGIGWLILSCVCSTNFTLEQNSLRNKSHSVKQPLKTCNLRGRRNATSIARLIASRFVTKMAFIGGNIKSGVYAGIPYTWYYIPATVVESLCT